MCVGFDVHCLPLVERHPSADTLFMATKMDEDIRFKPSKTNAAMSKPRQRSPQMQTKITKAVIPSVGFGTRMLPATKPTPKDLLTVVDKPSIQYVVE